MTYLHLPPCSNTAAEFEGDVRQAEQQIEASRLDKLALEEAGTYADDPKLRRALDDAATGGEFYKQLHALFREILETDDDEKITVGSTLREQVQRVAINRFRPAIEELHR